MMTLRKIMLGFTVIVFPWTAFAEDESNVVKSEFKDIVQRDRQATPDAKGDPLSAVVVSVEADRVQPDCSAGLRLDVYITNRGTEAIELLEPTEFIQVQVVNATGFPVTLPPIPTGALRPHVPKGHVYPPAGIPKPFHIVKPPPKEHEHGEGEHEHGEAGHDHVHGESADAEPYAGYGHHEHKLARHKLNPGGRYHIRLKVTEILADPEKKGADAVGGAAIGETAPGAYPRSTPIRSGEYTVKVWLVLKLAIRETKGRALQSGELTVTLGKPELSSQ